MIRKFIKKLLKPIVREVIKEIKTEDAKDMQAINDSIQSILLKAVNDVNQIQCNKIKQTITSIDQLFHDCRGSNTEEAI
jgi:hypothetical protein